jgi:hypothetical protein
MSYHRPFAAEFCHEIRVCADGQQPNRHNDCHRQQRIFARSICFDKAFNASISANPGVDRVRAFKKEPEQE